MNDRLYVSTACINASKAGDAVERLNKEGFRCIEFSGGTETYPALEKDLLDKRERYGLHYLCHNYFPPPAEHFVLNLCSSDDSIFSRTVLHLKAALQTAKRLGSAKFGFHAGFFVDLSLNEIGGKVSRKKITDRRKKIERFCFGFGIIKTEADLLGIELYIENNVLSRETYDLYNRTSPFMLTNYSDVAELRKNIDFKLLLDVGHLKVSANSLGLDFSGEMEKMAPMSDYLHISDNNGLADENKGVAADSDIVKELSKYDMGSKTVTLEVAGPVEEIKKSYETLLRIC